ncbi:glycosyltransferase family 2 protein [Obba rivulosa]|uniref:Chitin synthase n=1 Tax=Obba rivulosa TaxID=1052685 RepID=A0A8E2DIQ0_9APHY|nr:glycosyltransferase family 2 protein [Obba rivulosa]
MTLQVDEHSGRQDNWRNVPSPGRFDYSSPSPPLIFPSDLPEEISQDNSVDYKHGGRQSSTGTRPQNTTGRRSQFRITEDIALDKFGNFVLDRKIPARLREIYSRTTNISEEDIASTHVRYSAATCNPDQFEARGFTLRQGLSTHKQSTKLFVVVTMYNENDVLFRRTMYGVMKNIAYLCNETPGAMEWQNVIVCIVSDGRQQANPRTLDYITTLGAYQTGIAKNAVNGEPVIAHIFEHTTQIDVDAPPEARGFVDRSVPIQILFCLKEKNQKKLNSHRWFFEAFGPILQPEVCILLDVGTMPGPTAFYHIWRAFEINPRLGGACGEVVALKGKHWLNLLNPLVGAQNFEYKMSNILDKSLESVFGYISVLPGAFSAYRYAALQNDSKGEGPLQKYFLAEKSGHSHVRQNIFMANMYLAEDRILCWELVTKRAQNWVLHYVKSAYAVTDVPDTVSELISQRRRWMNGSLFAALHSIMTFYYIWRSSHSFMRKLWIQVEMLYQLFSLILAWFSLGNYFIAYKILTEALEDTSFNLGNLTVILNMVLEYLYICLLILSFLLALGNKPHGSKWFYTIVMAGFAIITVYMMWAVVFLSIKGVQNAIGAVKTPKILDLFVNPLFRDIVVSLFATVGVYVMASIIQLDVWHLITSFVQYMLMIPSYINVLNVYAVRTYDVSWGTKGDTQISYDLGVIATGNRATVQIPLPSESSLDAAFEEAWRVRNIQPPEEEPQLDEQALREASDRNFRTKYVPIVSASNALVAAFVVTVSEKAADSSAEKAVNGYLAILLFSIAGRADISAFQFFGSVMYVLIRLHNGE